MLPHEIKNLKAQTNLSAHVLQLHCFVNICDSEHCVVTDVHLLQEHIHC
jgi:hypothetical protein